MKAITCPRFGPPESLRFEEIDEPTPRAGEVLVRVRGASVNPRDWHFMRGLPYVMRPLDLRLPPDGVLGSDLAGQVEAVGEGVTRFRPGDEVYGHVLSGAFAEYASVPEGDLAIKPASLSFEAAAAVPLAGLTALQGLRDKAGVEPGHKVLIVGAGGGVGTFAVQLAKLDGAEVTAVCGAGKADLVRSLGADHVLDYARQDFTRGAERYDLVFQLAGTAWPSACRRALAPSGTLLPSSGESRNRWVGPLFRMVQALALSPFTRQRLLIFLARRDPEDLDTLRELIDAGRLAPVIDRAYPLAEVPEAIRYLEAGHARGKIVVTV